MAIQGKSGIEVVTIYDPTEQAYREVAVQDYILQLQALGLSAEEAQAKVDVVMAAHKQRLLDMGVAEEHADAAINSVATVGQTEAKPAIEASEKE